jgi:hypothetical protein
MSVAGFTVSGIGQGSALSAKNHEEAEMTIECGRCEARGLACGSCAAAVIVGEEAEIGPAELRALTVLANAGMIPPLRYAPRMAKAS